MKLPLLSCWALLLCLACLVNVWACPDDAASSHVRRSDRTLQGTGGKGEESFRVGDYTWDSPQAFIESGARCHTRRPSPDEVEEDRQRVNLWERSRDPGDRRRLATVTIDVYWHTIQRSNGDGQLTAQQIADSISVLNAAFAAAGFQFNLIATDTTTRDSWYNLAAFSNTEFSMKAALHQGTMADLNVYSVNAQDGLLGWATFPMWQDQNQDGVVILYSTVPGGTAAPFNEGDTLTHEVGHWMGLYHTFEGGCDEPGDLIGDTPAQLNPSDGCPLGRNSCTNKPGLDPIRNFMDYSDDSCMNTFTSQQRARMQNQWDLYRSLCRNPTCTMDDDCTQTTTPCQPATCDVTTCQCVVNNDPTATCQPVSPPAGPSPVVAPTDRPSTKSPIHPPRNAPTDRPTKPSVSSTGAPLAAPTVAPDLSDLLFGIVLGIVNIFVSLFQWLLQ